MEEKNYRTFLATVEILVAVSDIGKTSVEAIPNLQTKSTTGKFYISYNINYTFSKIMTYYGISYT